MTRCAALWACGRPDARLDALDYRRTTLHSRRGQHTDSVLRFGGPLPHADSRMAWWSDPRSREPMTTNLARDGVRQPW